MNSDAATNETREGSHRRPEKKQMYHLGELIDNGVSIGILASVLLQSGLLLRELLPYEV